MNLSNIYISRCIVIIQWEIIIITRTVEDTGHDKLGVACHWLIFRNI